MLVVPAFLFWTGFVGVVVVALVLAWRAVTRRKPVLGAIAVVGMVAAVVVRLHTYDAVVVDEDGGVLRATRMLTIGEPDHDPEWRYARHPTWILNRSSQPVALELVGDNTPVLVPATTIAPGGVGVDRAVDYLGPDDPPPRTRAARGGLWLRWRAVARP